MAKFNFFKGSNKLDNLEPSEIQQQIDDKKEAVSKLEEEIIKTDDFLNGVSDAYQDDLDERKENLQEITNRANHDVEELKVKKETLAKKRQAVIEKNDKESRKTTKVIAEIKEGHDTKKSEIAKEFEQNQSHIKNNTDKFKLAQDKKFISSRNELIEEVNKQKETLTSKSMKNLENQKREVEKLRASIEQLEAKQQSEINVLKEKLAKELEVEKITHDTYVVEVNNLKASQQVILENKRAEVESKLNQWKSDYNQYAATNRDFIERKKAELALLQERESSLRETLRQKQKNVEIERNNFEKDHKLRVDELTKQVDSLNQKIQTAQKDYEVESALYEKEVAAFQGAQLEEKNHIDALVAALAQELEDYKKNMSDESIKLDAHFKEECNSIIEFYRDLLNKEEIKHKNAIAALEADMQRDEQAFMIDKKALEDKKLLLDNNFIETTTSIKEKLLKCNELMKSSELEHKSLLISLQKEFEANQLKYEENLLAKQQEYEARKLEIEAEVKKANDEVKEQLRRLDEANSEVSKQVSASESALNSLKGEFNQIVSEKQVELDKLAIKLTNLNETLIDIQAKRRDEKSRHESKMRDFTTMRQDLVADHRNKIDEIKKVYDEKTKQFEEEFVIKKKEVEDKHQEDLVELENINKAKIAELENQRAELTLQFEKEKGVYETKIHELEAEHLNQVQNENARLQEANTSFDAQKQNQKAQLEQTKEKFNGILAELRTKIDNQVILLKDQETNYKKDVTIKIQKAREEVSRLKNEEAIMVERISEIQNKFDKDKNELIKSTSRYLDEHLEKVGELESHIASKRSEIDAANGSLRDLINYYLECEEEEKLKLENLKSVFVNEQLDQNREIEASIAKLEDQKKSQLDVIRSRFETERKRIAQQFDAEIQRYQTRIEEEKVAILIEQAKLDEDYAKKIEENNGVIEAIKKQIKQLQNDAIVEETRFKNELIRLEKSHEFDRGQLQYELELKNANNEKYLDDLRIAFEQEQNEINLEKTRLANAIELKQKALDDKKAMFDDFFTKFQEEENSRKSDREYEIFQYEKNIDELQKHIEELNAEFEQTKQENQAKLDEVYRQQKLVKDEYDALITNRSDTFNIAVERVKVDHEKEVTDYVSQCDAQQAEFKIQNENILRSYQQDFDEYKQSLIKELDEKREDIAKRISEEGNKLTEEKARFESYINELRLEEDKRVIQRNEERERLNTYWENTIQGIKDRISTTVNAFMIEKDKLNLENEERIKSIMEEKMNLESDEKRIILNMQELENAFAQKKREAEEKARQYEEECYIKIADIERVIRQKEEKINAYRDEIKAEVLRAIEERKNEEKRLNDMVLNKEQLLAEEKEKIMTVIQKQQKIFEKLAAKKRAAMEEEILRNNKVLERELRRIEADKEKAGEEFSLSLEELNRMIIEKEKNYEELIAQQKARNETYIEEFRKTLQQNHEREAEDDRHGDDLANKIKDELLMNEQEVIVNSNNELSAMKNAHLDVISKLQANNNQIEIRLNSLRNQYEQLTNEYESDEDSQKHKEFFTQFERMIQERRDLLVDLENQENELRANKLEQFTEQNDLYNQMIEEHQNRILDIENSIYLEQKKLTDFEEDISRRRREQKEMEIDARNLFTKKLDYLKQKMFDN